MNNYGKNKIECLEKGYQNRFEMEQVVNLINYYLV